MRILEGALAMLLAGGAAAAPVPLKDFARHEEFRAAEISPEGDYLAVTMLIEGRAALGIIDLATRKVTGQLRFQKGQEVAYFDWVSPRRVIVSVARSFGPLDQPALTGELYGIDADGSRRAYLFGYRGADHAGTRIAGVKAEYASAYIFNPLLDDPLNVLVRIYRWRNDDARGVLNPTIDRLDIYSGKRDRVTVLPGFEPAQVASDRAGRLHLAVSTDEDFNARLYARADAGWKELPQPRVGRDSLDLQHTTADGKTVFLTHDNGAGRDCLRAYDVQSGVFSDRLCNDAGSVGEPVFSLDGSTLLGTHAEQKGRPVFKPVEAGHPDAVMLRALIKAFGGQRVRVTSQTRDQKRVVIHVTGDRNPGEFFLVDRATLNAKYLLSHREWIDPRLMSPVEPITYKTRDDVTIHGYLTARDGLATRYGPLVLMPHGGPHGPRDYWQWDAWAQALASRGYNVLQVNFRGSGGYGLAHQAAGYQKWGTLMQDDLTDAVRWVVAQGIADPKRICIMGGSYGGYAALMSAVREPDLYQCAIGLAGVYDLVAQSEDSDIAESNFGRIYLRRVLGDEATMRAHSPVTYIERLKAPVLIAHGTDDERVPFSQAKILRKALEKHGKSYEWAEYEDEFHGFYIEKNHEDFLKKSLEFLDKHIGSGAKPATAQTQ